MNKISKILLIIFALLAFIVISDYVKVQKVKNIIVYIKNSYDINGAFPTQTDIEAKFPSWGQNYQIADSQAFYFHYNLFMNEPFAVGGKGRSGIDNFWGPEWGGYGFQGGSIVPLKCISAKFESGGECLCIPYKGEFPQYLLNWQHTFVDSCN